MTRPIVMLIVAIAAASAFAAEQAGKPANSKGQSVVTGNVLMPASPAMMGVITERSGTFVSAAGTMPAMDPEREKLFRELQAREQRMLKNPEYRELLRARQRFSMAPMYADLPELLQISPQQADRLLDLLADQQVRQQIEMGDFTAGAPPDEATVRRQSDRMQQLQRTNEAEIAALLGDEKLTEWQAYQRSPMARFLLQRLRQSLPADSALRPEQLRPLIAAITQEQEQMWSQMMSEDRPMPNEPAGDQWAERSQQRYQEQLVATNERILAATSSILSAPQQQQLQALLQQDASAQANGRGFFFRAAPGLTVLPPAAPK